MSYAEARAELGKLLRPLQSLVTPERRSGVTFGEFVERVYFDLKARKWKASTRITTESLILTHLLPSMGPRLMHTISRAELQDVLDGKAAAGLSGSIVGHIRFQLQAIFRVAMGDGIVLLNPTTGLQTPRCKEPEQKRVLDKGDIQKAEMVLGLRERLIVRLAVLHGLRPGEVMGLQLGDVEGDVLHIRRRVYHGRIDTPKSRKGTRAVPLGKSLPMLQEYVGLLSNTRPEDWLFPSENDATPLDYTNVFRRRIQPALKLAGLDWANFQVMRRTAATQLRAAGVDPKTSADILGHDVDVDQNQYAQTSMQVKKKALAKAERALQ